MGTDFLVPAREAQYNVNVRSSYFIKINFLINDTFLISCVLHQFSKNSVYSCIPGVGNVGALKSTEWSGRIFNRSNTLEMECGAQL